MLQCQLCSRESSKTACYSSSGYAAIVNALGPSPESYGAPIQFGRTEFRFLSPVEVVVCKSCFFRRLRKHLPRELALPLLMAVGCIPVVIWFWSMSENAPVQVFVLLMLVPCAPLLFVFFTLALPYVRRRASQSLVDRELSPLAETAARSVGGNAFVTIARYNEIVNQDH